MPKKKIDVKINGKPVFYAMLYDSMKKAAIELGYTLAMHGSMHNDLDLIAVAWVEEAAPHEALAKALSDCLGENYFWKDNHFELVKDSFKPHGRICYTLEIYGYWFIDLSIIPPKK